MRDKRELASARAQELIEIFPGLQANQYEALGALCIIPSIPKACELENTPSDFSVYAWLGRIGGKEHRKDEAFIEAFEVCKKIGQERVAGIAIEEAIDQSRDEHNRRRGSDKLLIECIRSLCDDFKPRGTNIQADAKYKRVILEREP